MCQPILVKHLGETRTYGESGGTPAFWNGVALRIQRTIIDEAKVVTLDALDEDLGEANEPTVAEQVVASPVTPKDRKIAYGADGVISIPAAAYDKPSGNTRDVFAMKSFGGGLQIFLPRFFPEGQMVLRGGTWKGDANACTSGKRLLSGGYGKYENWGLRAAVSHAGVTAPGELTLDLGDGVTMEMVYIKPGTFVMGGESKTDGRFECVELPKHAVEITKGFYLGKYEVTQTQYQAIMGSNPSRSTKGEDCPVDNIGLPDAVSFCGKLAEKQGSMCGFLPRPNGNTPVAQAATPNGFLATNPHKSESMPSSRTTRVPSRILSVRRNPIPGGSSIFTVMSVSEHRTPTPATTTA